MLLKRKCGRIRACSARMRARASIFRVTNRSVAEIAMYSRVAAAKLLPPPSLRS